MATSFTAAVVVDEGSCASVQPGDRRPTDAAEVSARIDGHPIGRVAKRGLDLVVAPLALLALAPVLLVAVIAIKLASAGPAIFRQQRMGKGGRRFTMLKLRTMAALNDDSAHRAYVAALMRGDAPTNGGIYKLTDDPRVTGVGRVLRTLSLDEVPQLLNVIRGHMSLVGPRPPLPAEVELYDRRDWGRLAERPGLTGLWQVSGRCELTYREMIELDLEYVRRWSPAWLAGLLGVYDRWPHIAGAAGRIELAWPQGRPRWLSASREVWFARLDLGSAPRLLDAGEHPVGANMSVRRRVATEVGGFDPALGYAGTALLGNEEVDLFARLRSAAYDVAYAPDAEVRHVVEGARVSRRYLLRRMYSQGRSDVRLRGHLPRHGADRQAPSPQPSLADGLGALSRATIRNVRGDARRLARASNRAAELVDVMTGRAKQLGIARESLALAIAARIGAWPRR